MNVLLTHVCCVLRCRVRILFLETCGRLRPMVEFKAQVSGYEATKKASRLQVWQVFQTGSSPTDSKGIDLSYSYQALGGVGSTSQSSRMQNGGKSQHAERGASNVHSAGRQKVCQGLLQEGSWTDRFQQAVSSESKTRRRYEKSEWTKRESSRRKV